MSRPRRAFGSNRPGQLPATRIKILAAELSDPQRLGRARTYASDGSVVDIAVEHRLATATVLGSRPDPYLVELEVTAGFGPPGRDDVTAQCTCPDFDTPGAPAGGWCKHALAALLVVADEVAVEPDILGRWRAAPAGAHGDHADIADVIPITARHPTPPHPLAALLDAPAGVPMATIPDIEPVAPTPLGDADLDRWALTTMSILTRS